MSALGSKHLTLALVLRRRKRLHATDTPVTAQLPSATASGQVADTFRLKNWLHVCKEKVKEAFSSKYLRCNQRQSFERAPHH